MKKFNITGPCIREKHFMVDIICPTLNMAELVDNNEYIIIDKPPKCGKTTLLAALGKRLAVSYTVISINAGHISGADFESESRFCAEFIRQAVNSLLLAEPDVYLLPGEKNPHAVKWDNRNIGNLYALRSHINEICGSEKTVLIIDGADISMKKNYKVFADFIEMLETQQVSSRENQCHTFQSVIFASSGNMGDEESNEQIYNSAMDTKKDLKLDMSFIPGEIEEMLKEYEMFHNTGMDTSKMACEIYNYSGGHPLLISKLCKCMDEKFDNDWTPEGIQKAADLIHLCAVHNINVFV